MRDSDRQQVHRQKKQSVFYPSGHRHPQQSIKPPYLASKPTLDPLGTRDKQRDSHSPTFASSLAQSPWFIFSRLAAKTVVVIIAKQKKERALNPRSPSRSVAAEDRYRPNSPYSIQRFILLYPFFPSLLLLQLYNLVDHLPPPHFLLSLPLLLHNHANIAHQNFNRNCNTDRSIAPPLPLTLSTDCASSPSSSHHTVTRQSFRVFSTPRSSFLSLLLDSTLNFTFFFFFFFWSVLLLLFSTLPFFASLSTEKLLTLVHLVRHCHHFSQLFFHFAIHLSAFSFITK